MKVTIQCKDITSIKKEKTALVIPNAVQVFTESEKVHIVSLYTTFVLALKISVVNIEDYG